MYAASHCRQRVVSKNRKKRGQKGLLSSICGHSKAKQKTLMISHTYVGYCAVACALMGTSFFKSSSPSIESLLMFNHLDVLHFISFHHTRRLLLIFPLMCEHTHTLTSSEV